MSSTMLATNAQKIELLKFLESQDNSSEESVNLTQMVTDVLKENTSEVTSLAIRSVAKLRLDSHFDSLILQNAILCYLIYLMKDIKELSGLNTRQKELFIYLMGRLCMNPSDQTITGFIQSMTRVAEKEKKEYPEGFIKDLHSIKNIIACPSVYGSTTKAVREVATECCFSSYSLPEKVSPGQVTIAALMEFVNTGLAVLNNNLLGIPESGIKHCEKLKNIHLKGNDKNARKDYAKGVERGRLFFSNLISMQRVVRPLMANIQDCLSLLESHLQHPSFDSADTVPRLILKVKKYLELIQDAIYKPKLGLKSILLEVDLQLSQEKATANELHSAVYDFGDNNTSSLLSQFNLIKDEKVKKSVRECFGMEQEIIDNERKNAHKELDKHFAKDREAKKKYLEWADLFSKELHHANSRMELCFNFGITCTSLLIVFSEQWKTEVKEHYQTLLKQEKKGRLFFRVETTTPPFLRNAKSKQTVEVEKEGKIGKEEEIKIKSSTSTSHSSSSSSSSSSKREEEEIKINSSTPTSSLSNSSSTSSSKRNLEKVSLEIACQLFVQKMLSCGNKDAEAKRYYKDAAYHFQIFMNTLSLIKSDLQRGQEEDAAAHFHVLYRAMSVMWEQLISAEKAKKGDLKGLGHSHIDMTSEKGFLAEMGIKEETEKQFIELLRFVDYGPVSQRYPYYVKDLCEKQNLYIPKGIDLLLASKLNIKTDLMPFILSTCSVLDTLFGDLQISLTSIVTKEFDTIEKTKEQKKGSDLQESLKGSLQQLTQMIKQADALIERCVKENTQKDTKSLLYSRELVWREVSFHLTSLHKGLLSWINNPSPLFLAVHGDLIWTNLQIIDQQIGVAMYMKKFEEDYRTHNLFFYHKAMETKLTDKQEKVIESYNIGTSCQYPNHSEQESRKKGFDVAEATRWRLQASMVSQHEADYRDGMKPVFQKGYENISPKELNKTLIETLKTFLHMTGERLTACRKSTL